MSEATWIGRKAYQAGLSAASSRAGKLLEGETPGWFDNLKYRVADMFVFRNIKELLGLDRARVCYTGAAPISKGLLEWYLTLGLPITEVYGQTEIGVVTVTRQWPLRQGTVGEPIPHVELKANT